MTQASDVTTAYTWLGLGHSEAALSNPELPKLTSRAISGDRTTALRAVEALGDAGGAAETSSLAHVVEVRLRGGEERGWLGVADDEVIVAAVRALARCKASELEDVLRSILRSAEATSIRQRVFNAAGIPAPPERASPLQEDELPYSSVIQAALAVAGADADRGEVVQRALDCLFRPDVERAERHDLEDRSCFFGPCQVPVPLAVLWDMEHFGVELQPVVSCCNPSSMASGYWGLNQFHVLDTGYFITQGDEVEQETIFAAWRPYQFASARNEAFRLTCRFFPHEFFSSEEMRGVPLDHLLVGLRNSPNSAFLWQQVEEAVANTIARFPSFVLSLDASEAAEETGLPQAEVRHLFDDARAGADQRRGLREKYGEAIVAWLFLEAIA